MKGASIILHHVSVAMQGSDVLKDVSFTLLPNEHLAIVGPSGSGKTTLAKLLAGHLFAKGEMTIEYDAASRLHPKVVLTESRYGFKTLSHTSDFYYQQRYNSFDNTDAQTVWQELSGENYDASSAQIQTLLQAFGLFQRQHAPLIQLSSGEHKKFQLIKALLSQPQVLVLDNPFTGLDAAARRYLNEVLSQLAAGGTKLVVVTTPHQLPDCLTHVAILNKGELQQFIEINRFDADGYTLQAGNRSFNSHALPLFQRHPTSGPMVHMREVSVSYGSKKVLNNISWTINAGDRWWLKGSNGAGKSTLMSLINGDNPQAYRNEIYLFGKRRGTGESIWDIKQHIGFVSPELHAFYDRQTTCFNAIASGFFDTIGLFKKTTAAQNEAVEQWLAFLNLLPLQHKPFASLSFGTQRLLLLARALVKNPSLLILDEPCQGLDDEQKSEFVQLVNDLCLHYHTTLIYISHYSHEVPPCVDRVIELKEGVATQQLRQQQPQEQLVQ